MTYADIDICNLAVGRVGVDKTIVSLTEASKEARLCSRFYALARDEVLERAPWPFAVRAKALQPMTVAELVPGWGYAYATPADAASILEVVPAGEIGNVVGYYTTDCCGPWNALRQSRYAFRRALSDDGTVPVVLSGVEDAYAVYVSKVTNTAAFPAMLVSLIADRLAMEIAMPLTGDPRWFQVAQQRYAAAFIDTASRQYEQETRGPDAMPPSIAARG